MLENLPLELLKTLSDSIWDTILGAVVSAAGAGMIALQRFRSRRRLYTAVTGFRADKPPIAVIGDPLKARPGTAELSARPKALPLFGYGPLMSYASLSLRIVRALPARNLALPPIVLGSQFEGLTEEEKTQNDLLIIGYPAGNRAAAVLEGLMDLPVQFAKHPRRDLVERATGTTLANAEYGLSPDGDRTTSSDSGLVVRLRHPLNPERNILYIAGCDTFGVKIATEGLQIETLPVLTGQSAVIHFAWRKRWMPKLALGRICKLDFAALFSAPVQYLTTGAPVLRHAWVRAPDSPQPQWKRIFPQDADNDKRALPN